MVGDRRRQRLFANISHFLMIRRFFPMNNTLSPTLRQHGLRAYSVCLAHLQKRMYVHFETLLKTKLGVEEVRAKFKQTETNQGSLSFVFSRSYPNDTVEIHKTVAISPWVMSHLRLLIEESSILSEPESTFLQLTRTRKTLLLDIDGHWQTKCYLPVSIVDISDSGGKKARRTLYFLVLKLQSLIYCLIKVHFGSLPIL